MTTKLVLILITILYCAHSTSFSISVTSSCTNTQNGICTAWSQTGTITENTASCFPGQIEVMTSNGFKKMADLRLGDEIKSYNSKNGNDQFSKVLLWLHRQPKTVQTYLKLKSQELEVSISKYHNIASDEKYHFSFAHEMEGKKFVSDLKDQVISSVEEVELEGIYAPLTTNNNFYINYNGHQILVHCIANLRNPESYETILSVIMNASSYFYENPVESDEAYFHPVAKALTKYAPILLEGF